MTTPWVAFKDYGCYYRLVDGSLQAMPMLQDGGCDTQEACDVDWQNIDEETYKQGQDAFKQLLAHAI